MNYVWGEFTILFLLITISTIKSEVPIKNHGRHYDLFRSTGTTWGSRKKRSSFSSSLFARGGAAGGGGVVGTKEHSSTTTKSTDKSDEIMDDYSFSLYQDNDGSDDDPDKIPLRYLKMAKFNRKVAKQALNKTLVWREKFNVDTILNRPHEKYDICKITIPHLFCGYDATKHVVFFQQPALVNVTKGEANGLTIDELINHYVYVLEYCWNIAAPKYELQTNMTNVMDMKGLHMGMLSNKRLINFARKFMTMMSMHYPSRSYKTLICNCPKWFQLVYKIFSPILRESTKAKIGIYSNGKRQDQALLDVLGKDICQYLPKDIWYDKTLFSTTTATTGDDDDSRVSQMEQELRDFCMNRLTASGIEMNKILY